MRSRSALVVAITTLVGIGLGLTVGLVDRGTIPVLLVALSAPILLGVGMARPEIVLGLFLVAGEYTIRGVVDVDMGFYLGAIVFLLLVARVVRDGLPQIPIQVALAVAVALVVLLGVTYSQAPAYGMAKGVRFAALGVLAMIAPLGLLRSHERTGHFLVWLWLIGVGISLYAVVGSATLGLSGRLASFGGGPITLGRLSGVAIAADVYLLVSVRRLRLPALVALPVLVVGLLGSGSRGPVVAALIGGGAVLLGLVARRGVRKSGLVALASVMGVVVAGVWRFLPEGIVARFALMANYDPGASAMARPQMVATALRLGVSSPIAGIGTGSFAVTSRMAPIRYPHNLLAELFAENGAFVAAVMVIVLLLGIIASFRWVLRDGSPVGWVVVFGVIFCMANSMLSGDLNDNQMLFAFLSIAAAASSAGPANSTQPRLSGLGDKTP